MKVKKVNDMNEQFNADIIEKIIKAWKMKNVKIQNLTFKNNKIVKVSKYQYGMLEEIIVILDILTAVGEVESFNFGITEATMNINDEYYDDGIPITDDIKKFVNWCIDCINSIGVDLRIFYNGNVNETDGPKNTDKRTISDFLKNGGFLYNGVESDYGVGYVISKYFNKPDNSRYTPKEIISKFPLELKEKLKDLLKSKDSVIKIYDKEGEYSIEKSTFEEAVEHMETYVGETTFNDETNPYYYVNIK